VKTAISSLTGKGLWDNVCFRSTGARSSLCAVESPTMFRFIGLICPLLLVGSLMLLTPSVAQNVTTWHNDNYRTGQQLDETLLTPTTVTQSAFGLLWQNSVQGTSTPSRLRFRT
jgi:hypothetical protein